MNRRNLFSVLAVAPMLAASAAVVAASEKPRPLWRVYIPGDFGEEAFDAALSKETKPLTANRYHLVSHSQASGGWSFIFAPNEG